ncbi:ABC transporter ATP-binding protein [Perkinsela sp. CCAP 1560/4]|nr:ABC transporter ATP-binding protein [Perkinsela sp. CCAP 1560/4]|eukprot:KNH04810.1 ABC transporter ATP-binding protein [Perkinsela sp. CCAP 1560/4]
MRCRKFVGKRNFNTQVACFATRAPIEEHSNSWINRYERDFLRRAQNSKLVPQKNFEGPIDRNIADPIIGTFNFTAAKKCAMLKEGAFEESLVGAELTAWTNAKLAASILHIPAEEIPGITTENIDKYHHTFLQQNDMLTTSGFTEAAKARDTLVDYTLTELFNRQTKTHFARIVSQERMKLNDEFTDIWGENAGIVMKIFAFFFLCSSAFLVFGITMVFVKQPEHMDKVYDLCGRIFYKSFSLRNPNDQKEYVDTEKSSDVYVDPTILGSSVESHTDMSNIHKGHAILPSRDPVYEDLVADAAETLHRERQHVMRILNKSE